MVERFKSLEGKQLLYESYDRMLELWGIDKEERDIETRYGTTHIIISGSRANPPLLLIHGSGDNSAMMWLYNVRDLAKHFYVMAVDTFAGSGKSEPNESYIKNFDPALWIDDILNTSNISKTHLAGVSYGVNLSLAYAIKNPDRAGKIVCMAGYIPVKGMKSNLLVLKALRVFFPEILIPTRENAAKLIRKICGPNVDVFLENKELMNNWFYALKYSKPRKQPTVKYDRDVLAVFQDKALFLIGDSDKLTYHPQVIKMFDDNNLNYKIVKDAGHAINHEQAEIINREIINFLLE